MGPSSEDFLLKKEIVHKIYLIDAIKVLPHLV